MAGINVQVEAPRSSGAASEEAPAPPNGKVEAMLDFFWSDWRVSLAVVVVLAAAAGLLGAWLTPRGPITTAEALTSLGAALFVGLAAGLVMGSRWSILATPVVFVVVFELARMGTVGPTVDAIDLGGFYGIVAFVLGRVFHGLLVLAPMILGSMYGVWLAGRLGSVSSAAMGGLAWTFTGALTLAMIVVAFSIARPATTAPIVGPDGETLPGSVAELVTVPIGGHDQTMLIRGRSADNPVLLYLTGGPGGTDIGALRRDVTLEQDFTVVAWDQRGAGKSYSALDPVDTFTVDSLVADTIAVTNYLRDRFDESRIYLVGQSWGSTLGVLAVEQHPELYHAFVGVGQMVSQRETDIMFWEDALAWADETGNTGLAETLRRNGPPPYQDLMLYDPFIASEHDWNVYPEFDPNTEMPAILFVPEYSWMDRINAFKGFLDTAGTLYPQLQDLDFRRDVTLLEVPVYMVLGEHEARGRAVIAREWFELLEAPYKEGIVFEGAGHRAHFDQPGRFSRVMTDILEDTFTRG
ncbi:MAG TPA: alpha/beta fold hydrolase [Acidimicrobiia bacterium]|nr:alpha/beta fold hydrolase [Acidimicrobiia bacterium]